MITRQFRAVVVHDPPSRALRAGRKRAGEGVQGSPDTLRGQIPRGTRRVSLLRPLGPPGASRIGRLAAPKGPTCANAGPRMTGSAR